MNYTDDAYIFVDTANTSIKTVRKAKKKAPAQKIDNLSVESIAAKTEPQSQMIRSFLTGFNIIATGSAGTGKSYIASYLALD